MVAENALPGKARLQIVVVDHDLDALRRLIAPLRPEYEFHLTVSASEALALLARYPVVAIVAGQKLFSSTGLEVLIEARRRSPRATRILIAEGDRRVVEEAATSAGLFQILHRPCTPNQLKEALHAAARAAEALTEDTGEVEHVVLETPGERPQPSDTSGVPLTVLTTDADLFDAITSAVQGRHETFLATRLDDAGEFAATGRCPVLITDQALAQPALERITRHLHTHESALVTIAVGSREQGNALMGLLSTGVIHRFLLKPVTPGLARLAIDSASRQHLSLKAHPRTDPIAQRPFAKAEPAAVQDPVQRQREPSPRPAEATRPIPATAPIESGPLAQPAFELSGDDRPMHRPPGARRTGDFGTSRHFLLRPAWIGGALVMLLAAAAAAWWLTRERPPEVDPREAAIANGLASARAAFDAGAFVSPPGANAAHHYAEVLAIDPQHPAANEGLDDIAERFIEQAETLIVEGKLDEAASALAAVRQARPEHRRLRFLDTQLRKEQQDLLVLRARESASAGNLQQAQQLLDQAAKISTGAVGDTAEVSAAQETIEERERGQTVARSLDAARQRVAQGRFVEPPEDSAKFHLQVARRADPDNIAVQQALRNLGTRLTLEASQAIGRNQFDTARNWIAEAQGLGVADAELAPLRQSLEAAIRDRPKNELLQLVLRRTEENRLLEPAGDSARHHLARLVQLDAQFPGVRRAIDTLGARLVANAQLSTAQRQFDAAARLLSEARAIGFEGPELAAAEATLRAARAPVPFPPRIPQEVLPRRVKYVAPVYPRQALQVGAEGWVDVSYAVNAAGEVTDATVEAASRRGTFDRAALTAVRQWKFEPRPQLPPTFEQRIKTRVEFRLKEE